MSSRAIASIALQIPRSLPLAGQWLLHSGIQENHGGLARYYHAELGRNHRVSTEITGYAISAFCELHRLTAEPAFLQAAESAGRFLENVWIPERELVPFEWPETARPEENRAYFFDSGIVVRGLVTLFRACRDKRFLDLAIACGRGMARRFEHDNNWAPILQLPSAEPVPYGASWSNNPGCYQLKSALGWRELFAETGDRDFERFYETAVARALGSEPAFLPGTPDRTRVMDRLHAYCYFLEGLLPVADRPACAAVLSSGIEKTGCLLRDIAPEFARSDVYAQLLRIRLYADRLGVAALDEKAAAEEAEAIPSFQQRSSDRRVDGGFAFGKRNGERMPFVNPVSTVFCWQALEQWRAWRDGDFQAGWRALI
ncbi:MAG: hypothetical protein HY235_03615 [Acidobacteria bacterium]|nr:hypothetical protein [Acidobacteriota bacterium]